VVVETDPFLLALIGVVLRFRHRAAFIVYLQDIHPDVGVAIGRLKDNWLTQSLRRALLIAYHRADQIIVLSRDMRNTLITAGLPESGITCIPNWTDTDRIRPASGTNRFRHNAGIASDTFVIMYSGNFGATQQLDDLIDVADRLREQKELLFVLIGGGSAEAGLKAAVETRGLTNVRFFPYQSKTELGESLSAADLHIITAHPAALAYLMPSKLYGILAAARAILAVVPAGTELAEIVGTNRLGYVVPPADLDGIAGAILAASSNRAETLSMGARGRRLAEECFNRADASRRFADLIEKVLRNHRSGRQKPTPLREASQGR
jgi:glycosyltransferase involved in cell wall biosynthesis